MSPSKSIVPSDMQLECRHIVGCTGDDRPLVHMDEAERLYRDGGVQFQFCPICGIELDHNGEQAETWHKCAGCGCPAEDGLCNSCFSKIVEGMEVK